ncbi:MAG: hypothetical protein HYX60_11335 [Legionella longbeachae]|nr:hypothetical protein [Legionella longbeachae]
MKNDKERLMGMLRENKITLDDYNTLLIAMKKKSFFSRMESSLFLNPFQKIAGFKALIFGIIILLTMSYMGVLAKLYFLGPLTTINASAVVKQSMDIGFLLLAYQNIICLLILTTLFFIAAKMLQNKKLRIIDFLGTLSLARFPLLLFTVIVNFARMINPTILDIDMSKGIPLHSSMGLKILGVIGTVLIVWQIILYFYAMKESSGLVGKKLWLGFILPLIAGELIAFPLTTWFMN